MLALTLLWSLLAAVVLASFGYVDNGDYYTIDSGSSLVIEVSKTNGDIQSMKYNVRIMLTICLSSGDFALALATHIDHDADHRGLSTTAMMAKIPRSSQVSGPAL